MDGAQSHPAKQSVRDLDLAGKRVFLRADFNVPLEAGRITDDTRIRASLPTIHYLLDHGAAIIVASHLGRPEGKPTESLRMTPVAERLSSLLGQPVIMARGVSSPEVQRQSTNLNPGQIMLLENLRFEPGEETNDTRFAKRLAGLADVYVDDAFGAAHRAHASISGIARFIPSATGLLMEGELEALSRVLDSPPRPLAVVVGGAKVSSKIHALSNLLSVADEFFIGGGMANTFLKARGIDVGASLVEDALIDVATRFLERAAASEHRVHLPVDVVVAQAILPGARHHPVDIGQVPSGWWIVDIGPRTIKDYSRRLLRAGSVVWNGPMGVFEIPEFAVGTNSIARALAASNAWTIVGGGDSVVAIEREGLADRFGHVSTGGGASIEFLEGQELPGVKALQNAPRPESTSPQREPRGGHSASPKRVRGQVTPSASPPAPVLERRQP